MPIYLDSAATTRVCREAAQAACEAMTEGFGNPSSGYAMGQQAAARMKACRETVADSLGCLPEELTFLSCGTEGDNWAIRAAVEYGKRKGKHIITTAIEHAAVLEPIKDLERQGYEVTYLAPARDGSISAEHGLGRLKTEEVKRYKSPLEIETMAAIRRAIDPKRIMNPSVLF